MYLADPVELVTLSLRPSRRKEPQVRRGRAGGGCTLGGDWEVMVGGASTQRLLWPSEDPRVSTVPSRTLSSFHLTPSVLR